MQEYKIVAKGEYQEQFKEEYEILKRSYYMNERWYSEKYNINISDAINHYLTTGWKLLYDPSPDFSTYDYLNDNPDVVQAKLNPLAHYEIYGKKELRTVRPSRNAISSKWELYNNTRISRASYAPISCWNPRQSLNEFIKSARQHDYISFDIFDTLVLRNLFQPTDLFRIMGIKLDMPYFYKRRTESESECYLKIGPNINIYDIYAIMLYGKNYNITSDKNNEIERYVKFELEMEKHFCTANPYMKNIYDAVIKEKIPVIIVSDTYWKKEQIADILYSCGYSGWTGLFVSCDLDQNKGNGFLQEKVSEIIGKDKKFLHTGDNYTSDIQASKAIGWDVNYYEPCREHSVIFEKSNQLKSIPTSIRTALCMNKFSNGLKYYTKEYEHGYICGGMLTLGFCQWVHDFIHEKNIDRAMFLARDMDVVYKLYQKLYPEDMNRIAYVRASRSAMMELNISSDPEQFFHYYFDTIATIDKINLEEALKITRLEDLIPYMPEYGLKGDDLLDNSNISVLHRIYSDHIDIVENEFSSAVKGAIAYFKGVLKEARNVCAIDLGWNGTNIIEIKKFLQKQHLGVDHYYGLMIGALEAQPISDLITKGEVYTYIFSSQKETNYSLDFATKKGLVECDCFEALFTSDEPSLLRYDIDMNGAPVLVDGSPKDCGWSVHEMQKGMIDFGLEYQQTLKEADVKFKISSKDAYEPYLKIVDDFQYLYLIFGTTKVIDNGIAVATDDKKLLNSIGNIIKQRELIQ